MLSPAQSRATDGDFSTAKMFKLGDDGQLSAVGVFVNEDGKESLSNLTVSPAYVYNLTENYIAFVACDYYDADGDPVYATDEYFNLIVRRSDGLVFSAKGIGPSNHPASFEPIGSGFTEDGAGHLLASFYTSSTDFPGYVGRITLSDNKGTWEQLSTDGSPIAYGDYPKVFAMKGGVVATSIYFIPCWSDNLLRTGETAGIIYPNGGYDAFGTINNPYNRTSYVILEDALLEVSHEPKLITIGTSYGQSTVEPLELESPEILGEVYLSSWYETSDKVIIKTNDRYGWYIIFDKRTKKFSRLDNDGNDSNIMLWKENLANDGRFYGLVRENSKICKVVSFDPITLTFNYKDLGLANEIDITTIETDYNHAKAQMTGTRRSDGYKVAVSVDLKTAQYNIIFSDPNRAIVSLIPLN